MVIYEPFGAVETRVQGDERFGRLGGVSEAYQILACLGAVSLCLVEGAEFDECKDDHAPGPNGSDLVAHAAEAEGRCRRVDEGIGGELGAPS